MLISLIFGLFVACEDSQKTASGTEIDTTATDSVDQDNDGVTDDQDCDDSNPNSTTMDEDADCDGIPMEEDCDDSDPMIDDSSCDLCEGDFSIDSDQALSAT